MTAGGVEGNGRLTAVLGLVLGAMLLVEGFTILSVRDMITLHLYLGLMLIPPVLLKCASTLYRFGSYYGGRESYVDRGPPPLVMRLLGPLVIVTSLAVLGTGVWLIALGHRSDSVLTLHQASFIAWVAVMTIHFLGHLREASVACWREIRPKPGDAAARRRTSRLVAVAMSLALGVGTAAVFMPSSTTVWQQHEGRVREH